MSATNRGATRHNSDDYATPVSAIQEFYDAWIQDSFYPWARSADHILDPCCGGSIATPPPYANFFKTQFCSAEVDCVDIRDVRSWPNVVHGDFLTLPPLRTNYDLIASNPPFSKAQEFVDRGLELLAAGGVLIYLLRLNFLGSQKRKEWWQTRIPSAIYIHSKRPCFTDDGKTDACEYATFVWSKHSPFKTKIRVI